MTIIGTYKEHKIYEQGYTGISSILPMVEGIYNELLEEELVERSTLIRTWSNILVAYSYNKEKDKKIKDKQPLGFIQFHVDEGVVTITLGGVIKQFRKQGVYEKMYCALKKWAKEKDCTSIIGYTSSHNTKVLNLSVKLNRKQTGIVKLSEELID